MDPINSRLSLDAMVAMIQSDFLRVDIKRELERAQQLGRQSEALRVHAFRANVEAQRLTEQLTRSDVGPLIVVEGQQRPAMADDLAPPAWMRLEGPRMRARDTSRVRQP
ncbi:hypothetical protein ACFQWH_17950 [Mycolicibacterium sp. GCM10028919]|uniref:hypothetical protein n=1 Tax=Mycolicibacterium sp. GCM10028919 TaxID=3273401 RepID=UPI00360E6BA2